MELSIVIPCFNERASIQDTLSRLRRTYEGRNGVEIIVVDDASDDGTSDILDNEAHDGSIQVLRHEQNLGYGAALKTGIRAASGELVGITDADGTYPLEELPALVKACEGATMVIGARTGDDVVYSRVRRIPKALLRRYISWIARRNIPDFNSGLRVFRRGFARALFHILPDGFSFTTTITLSAHAMFRDVVYIPINYAERVGSSKIKPIRDTIRFINIVLRTGMYFAPLRAMSPVLGVLLLLLISSALYDIMVLSDMTDKTVILFVAVVNVGSIALLADMLVRRILADTER